MFIYTHCVRSSFTFLSKAKAKLSLYSWCTLKLSSWFVLCISSAAHYRIYYWNQTTMTIRRWMIFRQNVNFSITPLLSSCWHSQPFFTHHLQTNFNPSSTDLSDNAWVVNWAKKYPDNNRYPDGEHRELLKKETFIGS